MLENKLKNLIIEKYGSIRQFSLKIGIPYTTIDSILKRGIDNSNVSNVIKMFKALNISIDKSLEQQELIILDFDNGTLINMNSETIQIPVLGVIKAGIPIEAQQDILEYIEIPKQWTLGGKSFYGLKISGDSMYPKYNNNDIVIFEKCSDKNKANNKDCAVMVNGDDATFKKVKISDSGITLFPYNSNYDVINYTTEDIINKPVSIIGIGREKRTKIN